MLSPVQVRRPYVSAQELIGLFLYLGAFSVIFGFFALKQDSDPEDCFTIPDNDHLMTTSQKKDDEEVNVGPRFRHCFEVLFLTHLLCLVAVILIRTVPPQAARKIYFAVPPIILPVLLITHLVLFYSRFVHSGRVCSGDYLDLTSKGGDSGDGYLLSQGSFIKSYASILSVTLYAFWCCICFVSARRTAIKQRRDTEKARAAARLARSL